MEIEGGMYLVFPWKQTEVCTLCYHGNRGRYVPCVTMETDGGMYLVLPWK